MVELLPQPMNFHRLVVTNAKHAQQTTFHISMCAITAQISNIPKKSVELIELRRSSKRQQFLSKLHQTAFIAYQELTKQRDTLSWSHKGFSKIICGFIGDKQERQITLISAPLRCTKPSDQKECIKLKNKTTEKIPDLQRKQIVLHLLYLSSKLFEACKTKP